MSERRAESRATTFAPHALPELPTLAWCAVVRRGAGRVDVLHGAGVEASERWFCEGTWAGDYTAGDLSATTVMGSGGMLIDGGVLFPTPDHTLERLHSIRCGDATVVSNSLACALAAAGDGLDPDYPDYRRDLRSIVEGLTHCIRSIPTRAGNRVQLHYHCNVVVDRHGAVSEQPKAQPPEFATFEAYRGFLEETVKALFRNATDRRRRVAYRPVATISTGYDSPAAAVFARAVGCTEALTFRTGRALGTAEWTTESDSGAAIARHLGMHVREYDRMEYLKAAELAEAELLAYGPTTLDAVMFAWERELPGAMLFTGFHGDKVWDVHNRKVGASIIRGDASGANLGEFRLRVGFIHVPVPFIGSTRHPAIAGISQSPDMKPWRLDNDYDRPIPRRILEEAGVPRELFGQTKKATTIPMFGAELRGRELSERALQDFATYYRRHRALADRVLPAVLIGTYRLYLKAAGLVNGVLGRLLPTRHVPYRVPVRIPQRPRARRWLPTEGRAALFNQWAVERIQSRYDAIRRAARTFGATADAPAAATPARVPRA